MLKTICLPDQQPIHGSKCYTSGINRDSKVIDAVPLNLFNDTYCENYSYYNYFEEKMTENQFCAGLPSNSNLTAPFSGDHEEEFGAPLICLNTTTQNPIFAGITSSNSLSAKHGHPGKVHRKN